MAEGASDSLLTSAGNLFARTTILGHAPSRSAPRGGADTRRPRTCSSPRRLSAPCAEHSRDTSFSFHEQTYRSLLQMVGYTELGVVSSTLVTFLNLQTMKRIFLVGSEIFAGLCIGPELLAAGAWRQAGRRRPVRSRGHAPQLGATGPHALAWA